jgi:hypothetical protein
MYVCMYVYVYVCVCVCMYVYVHVYVQTHTHTQTPSYPALNQTIYMYLSISTYRNVRWRVARQGVVGLAALEGLLFYSF